VQIRRALLSFLVLAVASPAIAATPSDEFQPQTVLEQARQSGKFQNPVVFMVSGVANSFNSSVSTVISTQPSAPGIGETRAKWQDCISPSDPTCDLSKEGPSGIPGRFNMIGSSILPVCKNDKEENCIESLEISYGTEEYANAKFLRQLQTEYTINPDPATDFPGGSSASLWDDSTVKNSQSLSYIANVNYELHREAGGKFNITGINFVIKPYVEISGNYRAPYFDAQNKSYQAIHFRNSKEVWSENGRAGIQKQFPIESKFRLKVRTTNNVSGWFKGRIKNPEVSINRFSTTNNLITIEGSPVKVPTFAYTKSGRELAPLEYRWQQSNGGSGDLASGSGLFTPANSDQGDIFEYIDYFRPLAEDKIVGYYTLWSVNSTTWGNNNYCLQDTTRVLGIVSTNAMGYNGNSPEYSNGTINYRVAGMHYEADGKGLVEGTYDLLMRSDAARCLYGFSNAPVQASISITGDDEQKVAVTSMTEANGWIKLSAYGFNFSTPTISVKLSQEKANVPKIETTQEVSPKVNAIEPVDMASKPISKVLQKKSITCVKGKLTRKVSGTNPKCPMGFRKK
jgi:hypothetical protein